MMIKRLSHEPDVAGHDLVLFIQVHNLLKAGGGRLVTAGGTLYTKALGHGKKHIVILTHWSNFQ